MRAERQGQHAGQRSPSHRSRQPESSDHARDEKSAREIAGCVDGVHESGRGIGPHECVAHVRQHQRVGKAANSETDRRRQRQDEDQPRGMRVARSDRRGGQADTPARRSLIAVQSGRRQWPGRLAALSLVPCQSASGVLALRPTRHSGAWRSRATRMCNCTSEKSTLHPISGFRVRRMAPSRNDEQSKDLPWRPTNCCFSPATASAPK